MGGVSPLTHDAPYYHKLIPKQNLVVADDHTSLHPLAFLRRKTEENLTIGLNIIHFFTNPRIMERENRGYISRYQLISP